MHKTDPIICFKKVSLSFGKNQVLSDADFDIEAGDPLCVVGPNGGGKTTLLRLLLGLVKPDKGSITVFGTTPTKARSNIGYMPQSLHYDPKFPITVKEVVAMGLLEGGMFSGWKLRNSKSIVDALAAVGIDKLENSQYSELSGGQKQRVLIARAMVSKPALLLLDEPTANLDLTLEDKLLETLLQFHPSMKIIMVSHDLGFVSGAVTQVLCVNKHVHTHPTESISAELIEELYGSSPRRILHSADLGHDHHHH
ncbi:MAG: metal ABC transporter ATP-binding protein [Verrucomicrobia bacterium]|nr:metal ABC transporter ATP-binding protein [Verrucomicrobiota bacterium]MDA1067248.1 metal ABC transporter ATP-binding protein [Verrucomicrobiota bacterium]